MEAPEHLSEADLLQKFRVDYLLALQLEDYIQINDIIVPRFWEHFGKYYREYEKSWKDLSVSRLPIHVMIDPTSMRRAELVWVEQVLKGRIDLI